MIIDSENEVNEKFLIVLPRLLKQFIDLFTRFPEIGPRQAMRTVFWFIRQDRKFFKDLRELVAVLPERIEFCDQCFFPLDVQENANKKCAVCQNESRDQRIIAIVARETDVLSLEKSKTFRGIYFVLGGLVNPFENNKLIEHRLKYLGARLKELLQKGQLKEVIIALPFTTEAEATAQEVLSLLKSASATGTFTVSRLGRGIPRGGEIEFTDPDTLREALKERK